IREKTATVTFAAAGYYRAGVGPVDPRSPSRELEGIVPVDHREAYSAEEVIARLVDHSLFKEAMPHVGREMICGVGRVNGLLAGFIANRQGLLDDPRTRGGYRPGGSLYKAGIAKISAFSRACNADGIPIVWLQDISGF